MAGEGQIKSCARAKITEFWKGGDVTSHWQGVSLNRRQPPPLKPPTTDRVIGIPMFRAACIPDYEVVICIIDHADQGGD